jgi:RHS repeat-associated protein
MPTDFGYTGQRLDGTGLMFYHARYYAPYLNRWIQPDTIVPSPGNPQALNRYTYVYNNSLRHTDPSGHGIQEELEKFVKKAGKALAQGWTNFTAGVEVVKGAVTYVPYIVYPDNFCLGSLGCSGGIEYARSMYAESTYERRRKQQIFANVGLASYQDDKGRFTDSVSALVAISNNVAQSTKSTADYVNDMSMLILGYEHTAGAILPMFDRDAGLPFNSTGFGSYYGDPSISNNQVNHFWFFLHAGYQFGASGDTVFEDGMDTVSLLAAIHEMENIPIFGAGAG